MSVLTILWGALLYLPAFSDNPQMLILPLKSSYGSEDPGKEISTKYKAACGKCQMQGLSDGFLQEPKYADFQTQGICTERYFKKQI